MDVSIASALGVLQTADPWEKARLTEETFVEISKGGEELLRQPALADVSVPDKPARSNLVEIVAPGKMKSLGKGSSLVSRQKIVHSLAHIESWAIDLSWDIIVRFASREQMPMAFVRDFAQVAQDEASHFSLLAKRLKEMEAAYGDFPAHDGLWESATKTSHSLATRLAIEHMVHEARGLDVLPQTISRFRSNGDKETALLLEGTIYPEEITHVAAGLKWFTWLWVRDRQDMEKDKKEKCLHDLSCWNPCLKSGDTATSSSTGHSAFNGEVKNDADADATGTVEEILSKHGVEMQEVIEKFHRVVREFFGGVLKPPFNHEARAKAGFTKKWYEPLTVKQQQ